MIEGVSEAQGRAVAAARMLAGMDQAKLGQEAGVSGATISNLERGNDVRAGTLKSVKRALRTAGVSMTVDSRNGRILLAADFDESDEDEDG